MPSAVNLKLIMEAIWLERIKEVDDVDLSNPFIDAIPVASELTELVNQLADEWALFTDKVIASNHEAGLFEAAQAAHIVAMKGYGDAAREAAGDTGALAAAIDDIPEKVDAKILVTFDSKSDFAGLTDEYERVILGGQTLNEIEQRIRVAIANEGDAEQILALLSEGTAAELAIDVLVGDLTALEAAKSLAGDFNIEQVRAEELIDAWVKKLANEGDAAMSGMIGRAGTLEESFIATKAVVDGIVDAYASLRDKTITLTINAVGTGVTKFAHGGRLPSRGIAEVGEEGPEFIVDGVVMDAATTRKMKRLGLAAGQGHAHGGPISERPDYGKFLATGVTYTTVPTTSISSGGGSRRPPPAPTTRASQKSATAPIIRESAKQAAEAIAPIALTIKDEIKAAVRGHGKGHAGGGTRDPGEHTGTT